MIAIAVLFVRMLCDCFKPRQRLEAEILVLRHQLNVLQQKAPRRALHLRWPEKVGLDRGRFPQRQTITHQTRPAILVLTSAAIIDLIAVANIKAALAAVFPDRMLDEPGEDVWKRGIELSGIDPFCHSLNNVRAAVGLVASQPVQVVRIEPLQDPGPVQKIMDQRVDGDHAAADLDPILHPLRSTEQDAG